MNQKVPQWPLRFFRWFCNPEYVEDIEGDLLERFDRRVKDEKSARWLLILDVFKLFRPGIIRSLEGTQKLNYFGMIKNYYKVSIRNILRNKTFSMLNITGLSVGIASCLLIIIYVKNEVSYDKFNAKYDRTYRVLHYMGVKGLVEPDKTFPVSDHQVWGNAPVADAMLEFFTEVEHVARFTSDFDWLIEYKGKRFQEKGIAFADSTMYQIFDWNWIAGDPETALTKPNSIILSKELATKYFGNENPIGEFLLMDSEDLFEVTAVYDIPANAHFDYPGFISMSTFIKRRPEIFTAWGYVDFYTYFTLSENANIENLESQIGKFLKTYTEDTAWYYIRYEALADAYLNSDATRQPGPVGNQNNIILFISVAIFILSIACINFMNLSTARSVERAKEVAIRKTIGSQRRSIVLQFLLESSLLTFFAFGFAGVLVALAHPYLEVLVGKSLPTQWLFTLSNSLIAIGIALALGLLSGSYPAFIISKFKPVKVLKGSFKTSSEGTLLRKVLVVLQFSLSIILLVGTAVVFDQLHFLRAYDKGFDSEQILVIDYGWDNRVQGSLDYVKSTLAQHPDVEQIAASRATPGDFLPNAGTGIMDPTGETAWHDPFLYEIDESFIPLYGMEIVAGRNYSKNFLTDSSSSLIVNETAVELYGYSSPEEIIGKKYEQWERKGEVIGVEKDFNFLSQHNKVEPMALRYSTSSTTSMLSVKLNSKNYLKTVSELDDLWNKAAPYYPFVSRFNDANFNKQYEADARFGNVFSVFSILAVFVACLGLFGLTIYSTNQRAKEIGIRKVLGASTRTIVTILSYDFVKLFLIALIIAIPISIYVMNNWLQAFAYRIEMGWEVFALAAFATLGISLITMSFKTVSAARSNPVDILKDE